MSRCLCCRKLREDDELRECCWCGAAGPYCRQCEECRQCKKFLPGYHMCGENALHEIKYDEAAGVCADCDSEDGETWRTCLKHLKRCVECDTLLCDDRGKHCCRWRSSDKRQYCQTWTCTGCGRVPRKKGPVCAAHREDMRNRFIDSVVEDVQSQPAHVLESLLKRLKRE